MAWVRKTLYLREDVVERLRELREKGFVMSAVVEKALRSYLSNHHEKPQRVRICVVLSEETYSKIRGRNCSDIVERALENFFGDENEGARAERHG